MVIPAQFFDSQIGGGMILTQFFDSQIRMWNLHPEYSRGFPKPLGPEFEYQSLECTIIKRNTQSDSSYKEFLSQFKILLQNSSLLPNVNPDRKIHGICQNPLLEASGTLILQGQLINH
ncbi:unnamed protein product [Paramecium octaurelia]|uniref:Uncharacterized protein n=1 Tax=Paramecium octaurelia TaxID=43137 RepID=A0A8S1W3H6_PAROT|nr:unnamed protein product [Paramecium octaurelia]